MLKRAVTIQMVRIKIASLASGAEMAGGESSRLELP